MTLKISIPTALLTLQEADNDMFQIYDSNGKLFSPQWFATEWIAVRWLTKQGLKVTIWEEQP